MQEFYLRFFDLRFAVAFEDLGIDSFADFRSDGALAIA